MDPITTGTPNPYIMLGSRRATGRGSCHLRPAASSGHVKSHDPINPARRSARDIGYSSEPFLDVIRQTQRKCNNRQRRIERTPGGEYRAAGRI
jgi:hypothetical protein